MRYEGARILLNEAQPVRRGPIVTYRRCSEMNKIGRASLFTSLQPFLEDPSSADTSGIERIVDSFSDNPIIAARLNGTDSIPGAYVNQVQSPRYEDESATDIVAELHRDASLLKRQQIRLFETRYRLAYGDRPSLPVAQAIEVVGAPDPNVIDSLRLVTSWPVRLITGFFASAYVYDALSSGPIVAETFRAVASGFAFGFAPLPVAVVNSIAEKMQEARLVDRRDDALVRAVRIEELLEGVAPELGPDVAPVVVRYERI